MLATTQKLQHQLSSACKRAFPTHLKPAIRAMAHKGRHSSAEPPVVHTHAAARALVKEVVHEHKVVVFSRTWCVHSMDAKRVLSALMRPTDDLYIMELDLRPDEDLILDALRDITGARTTPRVFIGGRCVGGGDDVLAMAASGELQRLLEEVGIKPRKGARWDADVAPAGVGLGGVPVGFGALPVMRGRVEPLIPLATPPVVEPLVPLMLRPFP